MRRLAAYAVFAVRDLSLTPPLSEPWLGNAERLMRVANVSEMEKKLKKEGAPDATLWEGEELGLRYLLEDGKLNLTLRLLDEYVTWLAALGRPLSVSEVIVRRVYGSLRVASAYKPILSRQASEAVPCAKFEFGICVTLANAWLHKEALQTTDMPLLCHALSGLLQVGQPTSPASA